MSPGFKPSLKTSAVLLGRCSRHYAYVLLPLKGREVVPWGVKIINGSLGQSLPTGGNWVDPAPYAVHCGEDASLSDSSNHCRPFWERSQSREALSFLG